MVVFASQIDIANARLNLLYYCAIFIYVLTFVVIFFVLQRYLVPYPVGRDIWTRMYVPSVDVYGYDRMKTAFDTAMSSYRCCTHPDEFTYWHDPGGYIQYSNFTCVPLCGINDLEEYCISRYDLLKAKTETEITFVTSVNNEPFENGTAYNQFVAYDLDAMEVEFYYGTLTNHRAWFPSDRTNEIHSSMKDILTVVMDYKGREVEVYEPRPSMIFSLKEILELSGDNLQLDSELPQAAKNHYNESAFATAPPRVSGFSIRAKLECDNYPTSHRHWKKGPVCYLNFEAFGGPWTGSYYVSAVTNGGHQRARYFRGIRLYFDKTGSYKYGSFTAVYNIIVDMIVLARYPKLFALFFSIIFLGHHSRIYSKAIYENFDLVHECKGAAARLMTYSIDFEKMAGSHSEKRLTKERVAETISSAVHDEKDPDAVSQKEAPECRSPSSDDNRILDDKEIIALVTFVYESMSKMNKSASSAIEKVKTDLTSAFSRNSRRSYSMQHVESHAGVESSQFHECCTTDEKIDFKDFMKVFDASRSRGFMEKFFSNPIIDDYYEMAKKTYSKEDKELRKIIEGSSSLSSSTCYESDFVKTNRRLKSLENFAACDLGYKFGEEDDPALREAPVAQAAEPATKPAEVLPTLSSDLLVKEESCLVVAAGSQPSEAGKPEATIEQEDLIRPEARVVQVTCVIHNLNYVEFTKDVGLLNTFKNEVKRSIANKAGSGVNRHHVELDVVDQEVLGGKAIKVMAKVMQVPSVSADEAREALRNSQLEDDLLQDISAIVGIRRAVEWERGIRKELTISRFCIDIVDRESGAAEKVQYRESSLEADVDEQEFGIVNTNSLYHTVGNQSQAVGEDDRHRELQERFRQLRSELPHHEVHTLGLLHSLHHSNTIAGDHVIGEDFKNVMV